MRNKTAVAEATSEYDGIQPIRGLINIFQFCGLWPQNKRFKILYLIYGVIFQCSFSFGFFASQLLNFYFFTNMDQVAVVVFECTAGMSTCVGVINLMVYFPYMINCIENIKSFKCLNKMEVQMYTTEYAFFTKVMIFNMACCSFACLFSLSAPFFTDKPILPYPAWIPLDWEHNVLHYWIAYFYQLLGVFFLSHTFVLLECFHIFLLISIGVQLDILAHRLNNIGRLASEHHKSLEILIDIIEIFEKNGR